MALNVAVVRVTTTGLDDQAAGNTDSELIVGEILGIYLNYHASAPSGTDVTVKTAGNTTPSYNLLAVGNANTDGYFAPRAGPVTAANVAITDAHAPFIVMDKINVAVAQADALTDCVVAHIFYRD